MSDEERPTNGHESVQLAVAELPVAEVSRVSSPDSSLVYVAYPSSLTLRSANAVQTFSTLRELRALDPDVEILIPRWAWRESVFAQVSARHLLRLPFNVLAHLWRTTAWSYLERSWFAWRAALWLARRRGHGGRRVIYVRDAVCAAWFGAGLARLAGTRLIYECHALEDWNPSRLRHPLARPLVRLIDSRAIRGADQVVALTSAFRAWLDRAGLKPLARTATIPDAYDDTRFRPRDRAVARKALGVPDTAFVVTYAGLTWMYRGLDGLVRAFAALDGGDMGKTLLLVGGRESERATIAAQAHELGLGDAIRLPGQLAQEAALDYLAAADALVLPGVINGINASPLKLFEYAAMARPIVAPDAPAVREILGGDAYYFSTGDEAGLRVALTVIQQQPAEAAQRAERARARVEPFTYRARAATIRALATEVGEDGPPGSPMLGGGLIPAPGLVARHRADPSHSPQHWGAGGAKS
ncbi:MAG TPA: glycosyltransferase [Thermomicrobiales bacterium]|nr:glycosyltransferase [Thermomicrobiales bacterium]